MSLLEEVAALPRPFVLATITSAAGSAPGKPGFKMAVFPDGSARGTVGGGDIERAATATAVDMLRRSRPHHHETFELSADRPEGSTPTSMICGGSASVFFELFPARLRAALFGGGHVAQALAPLLVKAGYAVEIHDNRPAYATPERYPAEAQIRTGDYEVLASEVALDDRTACFIFTHGHAHDGAVLEALLRREDDGARPAYIGMIGSSKKIAQAFARLVEQGLPAERLERVYAPIGLDIGGDSPFEIAISICAELQALRQGRSAPHMRARVASPPLPR